MYSTEQAARVVQLIGFVLSLFGKKLGIENEELSQLVGAGIFIASTIYGWYRRYKKGDLTLFGARK